MQPTSKGRVRRSKLHVFEGRLLLARFDRGLSCCETGNWYPIGRTGHVVEAQAMAGLDAGGIAAVFATDADFQLLVGFAAALDSDPHQVGYAARIEFLERVLLVDPALQIVAEEFRGVITREPVGHLSQVVGAE